MGQEQIVSHIDILWRNNVSLDRPTTFQAVSDERLREMGIDDARARDAIMRCVQRIERDAPASAKTRTAEEGKGSPYLFHPAGIGRIRMFG